MAPGTIEDCGHRVLYDDAVATPKNLDENSNDWPNAKTSGCLYHGRSVSSDAGVGAYWRSWSSRIM